MKDSNTKTAVVVEKSTVRDLKVIAAIRGASVQSVVGEVLARFIEAEGRYLSTQGVKLGGSSDSRCDDVCKKGTTEEV